MTNTDKQIPHEKQRIQGVEKQQMDDRFRESMKVVREVVQKSLPKHDKDMTSELRNKIKDVLRNLPVNSHGTKVVDGNIYKKDWVSDEYVDAIESLLSQQREQIIDEVREAIKLTCKDEEVHCDYSCHVCGGVKEFLDKLYKQLPSLQLKERKEI